MRQIKKSILIILTSILSGYLLLTIVYSLNTDNMIDNTKEIIMEFENEKTYHPETSLDNEYLLDNFTDSLMISQAIFKSNDNPFIASLKNERFYYENIDTRLFINQYISNKNYKTVSYSRYWHGYLITLKPLLNFFNYYEIRKINLIIQLFLLFVSLVIIYKKINLRVAIAFVGSVLIIAPIVIAKSLQFSSVYYITLAATIYVLINVDDKNKAEDISILFLIIGIATSFFDLLTFPLLTYGIPAILVLMKKRDIKVKDFVKMGIYWITGYLTMWAGKWILASIILNENVINIAVNMINSRTSNIAINENISRFNVVIENYKTGIFKNLIIINLLIIIINMVLTRFKIKKNLKYLLYLAFLALVPVLWFILAANHTSIHYFYTYRIIMITVFAIHCILI